MDRGFRIKIKGTNTKTRIRLLFTYFYYPENENIFKELTSSDLINDKFKALLNETLFSNKRRIADEYRYCMDLHVFIFF